MSPRIFVFAPVDDAAETYERLRRLGCDIAVQPRPWTSPIAPTDAQLIDGARGSDALLGSTIYNTTISQAVLDASDTLRIIAKYSIGCEDVDVEAATQRGVLVTYGPTESNWGGVAEGTLTNMLVLLKKVRERDAYLKSDGAWRNPKLIGTYVGSRKDGYPGITIGIVGLGRVGSRLADLLRPWGARVIACDPFVDDAKFSAHGVERVDLPTLLKQSDVITLHVFLNRETRHLIGANEFSQMKPTAVFLNASRGAVVDEIALVDALNEGRIRAAALDVFEREPLPLDSPLRGLDERVLLSPHMITNNVGSGLGPAIQLATNALIQALRGEVPDDELIFNPDAIPTWTQRFAGRSVLEALPSNV